MMASDSHEEALSNGLKGAVSKKSSGGKPLDPSFARFACDSAPPL